MKVLFVTPQLPAPPRKGTTLRNYHLIAGAARKHVVRVVSIVAPDDDQAGLSMLGDIGVEVATVQRSDRTKFARLADLVSGTQPDLALRLRSPAAHRLLARQVAEFRPNVVQLEAVEAAGAVAPIGKALAAFGPAVVYDAHNAEFALQESIWRSDSRRPQRWPMAAYSFIQWLRLRRYEAALAKRSAAVVAVSAGDARLLERLAGRQVDVVPNGVDTKYYRPPFRRPNNDRPILLFVGTLDFRPNVDAVQWLVKTVLPIVQRDLPDARVRIVGRSPAPAVRRLAGPTVEIVGPVDDERPWLDRADCYVVPLRSGGGMRFKVVQAMASGVPIVSTHFGAEGVRAVDGHDFLLADQPGDFARAVIQTIREPDTAAARVARARKIAVEQYDWRVLYPMMEAVYERIGTLRVTA